MKNTVNVFRLVHKIALSILLLLAAVIPVITSISMITAFVVLPAFLIFIFLLSILIEQKLNMLVLEKPSIKKNSKCLIRHCLHKKCFS